jgi:hypothetical protein
MEVLMITCDRCGARVVKSGRTRVRWSTDPQRRPATDLCNDCSARLIDAIGTGRPNRKSEATDPTPRMKGKATR